MTTLVSALKKIFFLNQGFSSSEYWKTRYESGGNSGMGSYGRLAEFKASILNEFVRRNDVASIIEFGCGDGNQLTLAKYPKYTGYDISPTAIEQCRNLFKSDTSKEFFLTQEYDSRQAELAISLDVIFHLIEDEVFYAYMGLLFNASSKHVVIYSSNQDKPIPPVAPHVRHRNFGRWINQSAIGAKWKLIEKILNPYPYNGDFRTSSFADFYIYKRT